MARVTKMTTEEVDSALKAGLLDKKTVDEIKAAGQVTGSRKGSAVKYYLPKGKIKVEPQLFFRGLGHGNKPTDDMVTFRNEFKKLLIKLCTKEK